MNDTDEELRQLAIEQAAFRERANGLLAGLDFSGAIALYQERLAGRASSDPDLWCEFGSLQRRAGDLHACGDAYTHAAQLYREQGHLRHAFAACERALKYLPKHEGAAALRARVKVDMAAARKPRKQLSKRPGSSAKQRETRDRAQAVGALRPSLDGDCLPVWPLQERGDLETDTPLPPACPLIMSLRADAEEDFARVETS